MIKRILSMVLISGMSAFGFAQKTTPALDKSALKSPLAFTENKGQLVDMDNQSHPEIKFTVNVNGVRLYFKPDGVSYVFSKLNKEKNSQDFYRTDIEFLHADKNTTITGEEKQESVRNFYLPQCPDGITNVATYSSIVYHNLYPGIDLEYFIGEKGIKYQFIVHPNADASLIQMRYNSIDKLELDPEKGITAFNSLGEIHDALPVSFIKENQQEIKTNFIKKGDVISFSNSDYDKTQTLVIDPFVRFWGTYFGQSCFDTIAAMDYYPNSVYANAGIYVTGTTLTYDDHFPTTVGAFTENSLDNYGTDVFIARFNTNGGLMWSTLYSSPLWDYSYCIAANASGVAIGGFASNGTGLFGTPGVFQPNGYGAFIARFSASGARIWSTYYYYQSRCNGFPEVVKINGIDIDNLNNVVVCGNTNCTYYFATPGAFGSGSSSICNGTDYHVEGFVIKFNSTGNRVWSTFVPHTNLNDVEILQDGRIAIVGKAENNVTLVNASQSVYGGQSDAYLGVLQSGGNALSFATFLGGSGLDEAYAVTSDISSNIYITGITSSATGIASPGAYQTSLGGGADAFVAKYFWTGTKLWSTYYGGTGTDIGTCIAEISNGNIFIAGQTSSSSPQMCSPDAMKNSFSGFPGIEIDAFVAKFSGIGTLAHSTYYGNEPLIPSNPGNERITGIAASASGEIVVAGYTTAGYNSNSFSLGTPGTFMPSGNFQNAVPYYTDGFIGFLSDNEVYITNVAPTTICTTYPFTISYAILRQQFSYYTLYAELSDANGSFANPVQVGYTTTSTLTGNFIVVIPNGTPAGSNYKIRLKMVSPWGVYTILGQPYASNITIKSTPAAPVITNNAPVCSGLPIYFNTAAVSGASYSWTGPAGFTSNWQNAIVSPTTTANGGMYSLVIT
ncbi:MAG: hypothetical protein ABIQ40_08010, partial [Bacteroidia bacterium]